MPYCTKCILKHGHPGVKFNSYGECSICSGSSLGADYAEKYSAILNNYEKFITASPVNEGSYDSLLMLSGGKDSMYMLNKLKKETSKRIISYTYDLPYEGKNAVNNIKEIMKLIDGDYISFSSYAKYKQLMRKVFLSEKKEDAFKAEKTPCTICTSYLVVSACFMAMNLKIPYILYCADPVQMFSVETDLKKLIHLLASYLGWDFLDELTDKRASLVMKMDSKELPTVVLPYVTMMNSYSKENIIKELEKFGKLLPRSMGTSCSLYPLLEYYSYKNYDCNLDSLEYAINVRKGFIPRNMMLSLDDLYKKIIIEIAVKEELTEQDKVTIRNFTQTVNQDSEIDSETMYQKIISLRKVSQDLGIFEEFITSSSYYREKEEKKFLHSITDKIDEDF
ncbi:MAG: hypothetical protein HQK63_04970 [Desulfamplus sp.]|nr:hypothetical protein [Desulfamplus sp.]